MSSCRGCCVRSWSKFLVWAGGADPDTFRIKIWAETDNGEEDVVVYDNGMAQAIGGGSIVVHRLRG